ncbi:MAG: hypothetical protein KAT56_06875, partial [Sedimentisphaerales bacterium]|nr:hypothetical protein [Sedimentisphaerales bacterium]
MIKTKIIATLGPATTKAENIKTLIDSGVNVFRLNFSHGSLEEHADLLNTINHLRSRSSHTLAVMGDLCGPKIRTSQIEHSQTTSHGGPERRGNPGLKKDDEVVIIPNIETGTINRFGTNYEHFNRDVQPGARVLIDDGLIELRVIGKDDNQTICKVIVGGFIQSHKGINLPDTKVSTPSITERDWECVAWA